MKINLNQNYNNKAFKHLNKVKSLKNRHSRFNIEFIRTLVLIEKFEQAFAFSKSVWTDDEFVFETDLLLGLDYFVKKDYVNAEKHFERLNRISQYNLFSYNFIGNVLMSWSKASQGNKEDSLKFLAKTPLQIKKIQNIFLQCYFDDPRTMGSFEKL